MKPPPALLTAEWCDLAMLNYEVAPSILHDLVPAGTEIDSRNGRTFVSMVGFLFLRTRVLGLAVPGHSDFDEVNLRFYVRRKAHDGWRRGVVFVKEIVPRRAIAWLARALYNENYVALPMRHEGTPAPGDASARRRVQYEWRYRNRWQGLSLTIAGVPVVPDESSEEAFITEHYWGYARQRDGSTIEYRVEHPRWSVWRATDVVFDCDVGPLYGPRFTPFLSAEPSSAFVARGSPVTVRRGLRL